MKTKSTCTVWTTAIRDVRHKLNASNIPSYRRLDNVGLESTLDLASKAAGRNLAGLKIVCSTLCTTVLRVRMRVGKWDRWPGIRSVSNGAYHLNHLNEDSSNQILSLCVHKIHDAAPTITQVNFNIQYGSSNTSIGLDKMYQRSIRSDSGGIKFLAAECSPYLQMIVKDAAISAYY
jgi:hypothetical protein